MATTVRVSTFNVNQFSSAKHQQADLVARMAASDVVLCQETVKVDLVKFARGQSGWSAFQVRHGDNDGHANTGVLYRTKLGPATATECVFIGQENTRRRFLTAVQLGGVWYWSAHIFPKRDRRGIPAELAAISRWVTTRKSPVVGGLDINQCPPANLETATGLKWVGIDIDGFLSDLTVSNLRQFRKGFSDHPGVSAVVTLPVPHEHQPEDPVVVKPPAPAYLGPAAHTSAGDNKPPTRIVIHSTVSPCKPGGARDIAAYFRTPGAGGSAHYVVDPGEVVQVVYDGVIAWHAPPNPHSLGIEMCDTPGPLPDDKPGSAFWKAAKRSWRWNRPEQKQLLERTAQLAAQLCAAYNVPPVFLSPTALKNGKHGITTHHNVSQAWQESTHWDPGFWPRRRFMRLVRKEYATLTGKKVKK